MLALWTRNSGPSLFGNLTQRVRQWVRTRSDLSELDAMGQDQKERIARDLGLSVSELRLLVSRGPDAANLLLRRMGALRLDADEVRGSDPALFRDLQRLCAVCESRGRCARDLARESAGAGDEDWRDYCPNVATLNMLSALKAYSQAPKAGRDG